ncbi:30S ribosomal protein S8 [Candidatus Woesearchaeota archaeon]|nr:30S ribosomal protein S8 [Candidatus Woesearchaeota archaeon]
MLNDPLSNVLNNIMTAQRVGKAICMATPVSKMIKVVLQMMQDHQYIGAVEYKDIKGGIATINLLGKINNCGVIKPRFSVQKEEYTKFEKRFLPARDFGIIIVSTAQGLMAHQEAKQKGLGGKLIAFVY